MFVTSTVEANHSVTPNPPLTNNDAVTTDKEISWEQSVRENFIKCLKSIKNAAFKNVILPIQRYINEWVDDRKCAFIDSQLSSVSNLSVDDTIVVQEGSLLHQPAENDTFLTRSDLCSILEKIATQVAVDNQNISNQLRETENKLHTGPLPLTIKEWAYVSKQFDAISIKYKRSYNQQIRDVQSNYRQAKQAYKNQLANYNNAIKNENTPIDHTKEKAKLNRLFNTIQKYSQISLSRQQFLMQIIQDLAFMSKFACLSMAKKGASARIKQIKDEKSAPGSLRERTSYISGSVGTGMEIVPTIKFGASGKVTTGVTKLDVVNEENKPGIGELVNVTFGARAGFGVNKLVDLSAEYTQGISKGTYTDYADDEALVGSRFNELVKKMRNDPQVRRYLSRANILGCKTDFVMDMFSGAEVIEIEDLTEESRLIFESVKQRLHIFKGGITSDSFPSIRKIQKKSSKQEALIREAKTNEEKRKVTNDIGAKNANNKVIKKIAVPKFSPFKTGLLKNTQIITFNATAGLNTLPLNLGGNVTVKREKAVQNAVTYTSYCQFIGDALKPEEIKNNIRTLVQKQCEQFKSTLLSSWEQNTAQIALTQQGIDVLKMSAQRNADDSSKSNVDFESYLTSNNLPLALMRLRTDPSLQQGKNRWDFIASQGLTNYRVSKLDNEIELQFNYLKEDFKLYKNSCQNMKKLQNEIDRLQISLPPENAERVSKSLKGQIKKENAFCKAIRQRYNAKDDVELLYKMVMMNADIFINASVISNKEEDINRFKNSLIKFERSLLTPRFTSVAKDLKERAQIKNETDYEVTQYELTFAVHGGIGSSVKAGRNVTVRFEDHQSKNESDPFDYLDLQVGEGINIEKNLTPTLFSVLNQASHLLNAPILNEVGQAFNSDVLGKLPKLSANIDGEVARQIRWCKPHDAPIKQFTHIWTRDLTNRRAKVGLEIPIPITVPGLTANVGAGYSDLQTKPIKDTYTGNSLINWLGHFMSGINKKTGKINENSLWTNIEKTQQEGLRALFKNQNINNEIEKMRANVQKNKYLNANQKDNFVKACQQYIDAADLFKKNSHENNFEECLEKLHNLFYAFEPHWNSSNSNPSLRNGLTGFIKKEGRWVTVKLSEPVQMNKKLS